MKTEEIKNLSENELAQKLNEKRKELVQLNLRRGSLDKPHKISQVRKDIARMLTVSNQKKK